MGRAKPIVIRNILTHVLTLLVGFQLGMFWRQLQRDDDNERGVKGSTEDVAALVSLKVEEATVLLEIHNKACFENRKEEWIQLCDKNNGFLDTAMRRLHAGEDVYIAQIGAHVGFEENDPIASGILTMLKEMKQRLGTPTEKLFHWVFVEPSPPNYQRLQQNLKLHSNFSDMRSTNAAIVPDSMTGNNPMVFYSISDTIDPETGFDTKSNKTFPFWVTQISSFSKDVVYKHSQAWERMGLQLDDYIVETNVTQYRFSSFMEQTMDGKPPLLVLIDTEGFDCAIILGIDTNTTVAPDYMVFEWHHCGVTKQPALQHLPTLGYTMTMYRENAVAVLQRRSPAKVR